MNKLLVYALKLLPFLSKFKEKNMTVKFGYEVKRLKICNMPFDFV